MTTLTTITVRSNTSIDFFGASNTIGEQFKDLVTTYISANNLVSTRTVSEDELTATTLRIFPNSDIYTQFTSDDFVKQFFSDRDAYNVNNSITITETTTED